VRYLGKYYVFRKIQANAEFCRVAVLACRATAFSDVPLRVVGKGYSQKEAVCDAAMALAPKGAGRQRPISLVSGVAASAYAGSSAKRWWWKLQNTAYHGGGRRPPFIIPPTQQKEDSYIAK
jgi:hypothetical protein